MYVTSLLHVLFGAKRIPLAITAMPQTNKRNGRN